MKRSEMIKLMTEMNRLYYLEELNHNDSADRMLNFLEETGMLPPFVGVTIAYGEECDMGNEWEPE